MFSGLVYSKDIVVRDLGVLHDQKLLFDIHINNIISLAYKSLGFIMRISNDFKYAKTFKLLYCTLVRGVLEYASQIWNPKYTIYISRIEAVQKKFIKFLCFSLGIPYSSRNYLKMCRKFHFLTLESRREVADLVYLHKIATSKINCPELLTQIQFRIPGSVRHKPLLVVPRAFTTYRQNSFFVRVSS